MQSRLPQYKAHLKAQAAAAKGASAQPAAPTPPRDASSTSPFWKSQWPRYEKHLKARAAAAAQRAAAPPPPADAEPLSPFMQSKSAIWLRHRNAEIAAKVGPWRRTREDYLPLPRPPVFTPLAADEPDPPEHTLHSLLGRDPDNALRFHNLSKWPPPKQLEETVARLPHLGEKPDRTPLVLRWTLDTIAKRPDTLVHNGAVRYIVNVLGNSIAQDHTRRGQPVPDRAELDRQALDLMQRTVRDAEPVPPAPSGPNTVNSQVPKLAAAHLEAGEKPITPQLPQMPVAQEAPSPPIHLLQSWEGLDSPGAVPHPPLAAAVNPPPTPLPKASHLPPMAFPYSSNGSLAPSDLASTQEATQAAKAESSHDPVKVDDANQWLKSFYQPKEKSTFATAALALGDMPFRVVGGVAAGGNPVVQYEYQKRPFTPLNSVFKYADPPKPAEALSWTNAQLAFNDALEAGLVVKDSSTIGRGDPVRIKLLSPKGDGTPGMAWVLEPGQKNPDRPSDHYQLQTPTASDVETRQTWVPALGYVNPNSNGHNFVRYDAVDQANYIVYDRKWGSTNHTKQLEDIKRQIRSLVQNPDWTLVVEVPNTEVGLKVAERYAEAMKDFTNTQVAKIRFRMDVLPPDSPSPNRYDSMPLEAMPPPPVRVPPPPRPGAPQMRPYRGR